MYDATDYSPRDEQELEAFRAICEEELERHAAEDLIATREWLTEQELGAALPLHVAATS